MTATMEKPVKTLKLDEKQNVKYAIPTWLRDEQIRLAVKSVAGRVQPVNERREDPIAIVGFGHTLKQTWEKIKDFRYVMTCSGSHRFLLDRGVVPNWHVEVDPRDHKIGLLGEPHPDVEYLAASACHPKYFDHLRGFNVKLWHVFDPTEDGLRLLPAGEWAVTGGCDVGLRAMTLASFLGFRDLHIFGLDGCAEGPEAERHAAAHPNGKQKYGTLEHEGKTYWTTPGMLEAARQTVYELKQMPAVRATFYGEGLTQALTKDYQPARDEPSNKPYANVVGFAKPELISADYRRLNAQLHTENLAYGVGGGKHADTVLKLAAKLGTKSILDYGCGKGYLAKAIPFPIWEYDPAVPGKEETPRPADLVTCTDVLEHIEPDKLNFVLDDLRRVTKQIGYFTIHTGPAQKTLADGRNAHLIQRDKAWWKHKLKKFFTVGRIEQKGPELHVVVGVKSLPQKTAA